MKLQPKNPKRGNKLQVKFEWNEGVEKAVDCGNLDTLPFGRLRWAAEELSEDRASDVTEKVVVDKDEDSSGSGWPVLGSETGCLGLRSTQRSQLRLASTTAGGWQGLAPCPSPYC